MIYIKPNIIKQINEYLMSEYINNKEELIIKLNNKETKVMNKIATQIKNLLEENDYYFILYKNKTKNEIKIKFHF